ncbi:MAG: hypothetical protein FWF10_09595 [Clostridiales bacterium]|nr:hypothetical protein [Clostridiales bacterium]
MSKLLIWILVILSVFLLALRCFHLPACAPNGYTPIVPPQNILDYSTDEVTELYWAHKDALSEVAEIVLASDAFRQRIKDSRESEWAIGSDFVKDDFSEEDWSTIVDFFEKFRPSRLSSSLRNNDNAVYIDFGEVEEDGSFIHTMLFYIKNPTTAQYYAETQAYWIGTMEQLDGYWYIAIKTDDESSYPMKRHKRLIRSCMG